VSLLFIAGNRIGDCVLATGILGRLLEDEPTGGAWLACGPVATSLFAGAPGLARVMPMTKRPMGGHWLALWAAAVGRRWRRVVDLRGSALAWSLWAGERIVWRGQGGAGHQVERLGRLIGADPPPAPRLWLPAAGRAATEAPFLALAPVANFVGKTWPADRFVALARGLVGAGGPLEGAEIRLYGAPSDGPAIGAVASMLAPLLVRDRSGLGDLAAVAADLARARLFIGNDSGLMHLAAAAGAPTLGLFGPSPIDRYRPWGPRAAWAATTEVYPAHWRRLEREPAYRDHMMDGLSVAAALAAAVDLIERTRP
jgi:lipopolysaccharide export system permease protein